MKHTSCFGFLFLNLFKVALSFCGSEIKNESTTISYPFKSIFYKGSIAECNCTSENICVRKCCGVNYIFDNETCVFSTKSALKAPLLHKNSAKTRFVPGMVKCSKKSKILGIITPDMSPEENISMLSDGKLWMPFTNMTFNHDEYCLEYSEPYGLIGYVCFNHIPTDLNISERLSFIGMMISLPFLLATFIVYALLPERNLHGMSLMCYVSSLFVAYILPVLVSFYRGEWSVVACRVILMSSLFGFMSSIFWMNVMSFDIFSTFTGSRGYSPNRKQNEKKRFLFYSLYAWGCPMLLVVLVVTINNTVKPNTWYDPGVRGEECFLRDGYPELLYFYGPLAILVTGNLVMFIVTALKIRKIHKDTAMLMNKESKKHGSGNDDEKRFKLYIRLLFAMGINWSIEIITWAVNWKFKNIPPAVWYVTDFCNAAYGVAIFFLFVFKKSIWKSLKQRYYKVKGKQKPDLAVSGSSVA